MQLVFWRLRKVEADRSSYCPYLDAIRGAEPPLSALISIHFKMPAELCSPHSISIIQSG